MLKFPLLVSLLYGKLQFEKSDWHKYKCYKHKCMCLINSTDVMSQKTEP
jgi:hypothetical protein